MRFGMDRVYGLHVCVLILDPDLKFRAGSILFHIFSQYILNGKVGIKVQKIESQVEYHYLSGILYFSIFLKGDLGTVPYPQSQSSLYGF